MEVVPVPLDVPLGVPLGEPLGEVPTVAEVDAVPAGQRVQVALLEAPVAFDHDPAGQGTQAFEPRAELYVPAKQRVHVVLAVAPVELEKVPAGQGVHAVVNGALQEPTAQQMPAPALLFKPAAQGTQEV
jgi:hypothetical protein